VPTLPFLDLVRIRRRSPPCILFLPVPPLWFLLLGSERVPFSFGGIFFFSPCLLSERHLPFGASERVPISGTFFLLCQTLSSSQRAASRPPVQFPGLEDQGVFFLNGNVGLNFFPLIHRPCLAVCLGKSLSSSPHTIQLLLMSTPSPTIRSTRFRFPQVMRRFLGFHLSSTPLEVVRLSALFWSPPLPPFCLTGVLKWELLFPPMLSKFPP